MNYCSISLVEIGDGSNLRWVQRIEQLSFKSKLFLYALLFSTLPILTLGIISSQLSSASLQEEVNAHHRSLLQQMQMQVDTFLTTIDGYSVQLATQSAIERSMQGSAPSMQTLDETSEMKQAMMQIRSASTIRFDVSLLYLQHNTVFSNRYGFINDSDFPYLNLVRDAQTKFDGPVIISAGQLNRPKEILFIRPVPVFLRPVKGVIVLHVPMEKLLGILNQFDVRNKILVLDEHGRTVFSNRSEEGEMTMPSLQALASYMDHPLTPLEKVEVNGNLYQVTVLKSSFNNWSYVAMTPMQSLTEKPNKITSITWLMVITLSLALICVAYFGSRQMYRPINRLALSIYPKGEGESKHPGRDGLQALSGHLQSLANQWKNNLPYLRETVLLGIIWGVYHEKELEQHIEHYGLPLKRPLYFLYVLEWNDYSTLKDSYKESDRALLLFAFRKIAEELCQEAGFDSLTASPQPGQVVVIVGLDRPNTTDDHSIYELADRFREKSKLFLKATVTVSISSVRGGLSNLHVSYREGVSLLGLRMFLGTDATVSGKEVRTADPKSEQELIRTLKLIASEAVYGDIDAAVNKLRTFVNLLQEHVPSPESVRGLFSYLLGELSVIMAEAKLPFHGFIENSHYERLHRISTVTEAELWLVDEVLPAIKQHIDAGKSTKVSISKLVHYIHEHYDTDLTLQQLADMHGLYPSQLSSMFKEEMKINFAEYLMQYRMNKAKQWLAQTEMPVKSIAETLRYTTVQNFTRSFKQAVGIPPAQYRKQFREGGTAERNETTIV